MAGLSRLPHHGEPNIRCSVMTPVLIRVPSPIPHNEETNLLLWGAQINLVIFKIIMFLM